MTWENICPGQRVDPWSADTADTSCSILQPHFTSEHEIWSAKTALYTTIEAQPLQEEVLHTVLIEVEEFWTLSRRLCTFQYQWPRSGDPKLPLDGMARWIIASSGLSKAQDQSLLDLLHSTLPTWYTDPIEIADIYRGCHQEPAADL